jgi:predicted ATPase/class 3 adenylate cyclase
MRSDLPTGTVTFLFTDIEGSTKLLHELGAEAYADALADHRRVIREACASHGGVEVDTQGDAFFIAFPTAAGAITAAAEMTEALSSGPVGVRIGLHTGRPLLTGEGYVGDDVHFAARVAASGHGGQVLVSSVTVAALEPSDKVTQGLRDLGEHRLKDIEEAVSIFQHGDGRFPPLKTISNTNLPGPVSSFVGREQELADVIAGISAGARLFTLTGPGGSGKTRLALEAAATLVPEYKAGVFWVGLASLRDPALVTETISQTLGAKDGLQEHIGERELLLLLDNLEQVIEAAPELSSLLFACPNLTLLVTSRELLRVSGEVEYPVPPLQEPEAIFLFCERAQLEPSSEIAELCSRLDSLPLAVELAAARAKALSPAQILERLSQRLDLFTGGRDADPRQQTLRATIEWSYDLLSEGEQQLLRRLAVFSGGCTLEAAEEVADADLDTMQSLVEKSLLRFSDERYWMLETIREYAVERFGESDEADELKKRHVEWFAVFAEEAAPHLKERDPRPWLERIGRERGNLRAALESCSRLGLSVLKIRLAGALGPFWFLRGELFEGRRWIGEALADETADSRLRVKALPSAIMINLYQGSVDVADELAQELFALSRCLDAGARAEALHLRGVVAGFRRDFTQAAAFFERSAELSREAGYSWLLPQTINNLGDCAMNLGDAVRAEAYFQEVLTVAHATGNADPATTGIALANLGMLAVDRGDVEQARAQFVDALGVSRDASLREASIAGSGLVGLAWVAAATGDTVRAARLLAAAETFLEEVGGTLQEFETRVRDRTQSVVRSGLSPEGVTAASAEGRGLGLDEAVEYALSSLD